MSNGLEFMAYSYGAGHQPNVDREARNTADLLRLELGRAEQQVAKLTLMCTMLAEMLERRGVATKKEQEVLMQQLDLLDGVEDGVISSKVREASPRCVTCKRFLNPKRSRCVYCDTPIEARAKQAAGSPYRDRREVNVVARQPDVDCVSCSRSVPAADSLFTERGVVCEPCFAEQS